MEFGQVQQALAAKRPYINKYRYQTDWAGHSYPTQLMWVCLKVSSPLSRDFNILNLQLKRYLFWYTLLSDTPIYLSYRFSWRLLRPFWCSMLSSYRLDRSPLGFAPPCHVTAKTLRRSPQLSKMQRKSTLFFRKQIRKTWKTWDMTSISSFHVC